MTTVLHLMPTAAWRGLGESEPVTSESLSNEGFIHCTDAPDVLLGVANAFYSGQAGDFVVLHVDVESLSSKCIWEPPAHIADNAATAGDRPPELAPLFPHIYGPIDRTAVVGVQPMLRDRAGRFSGFGTLDPNL